MFSSKPNIVIGNKEKEIFEKVVKNKVLIITDKFLKDNGNTDYIVECLPENIEYQIYDDIQPDPPQEVVDRGADELIKFNADSIICFGGGSVIDASKAMIYTIMKSGHNRPKFVAIPTTAGTGSEVTNFSIITKGHMKDVLIDDAMLPDYAILNARHTRTVPKHIVADTGVDVLTHGLEAYLSINANTFTDTMAIKSIKLVFEHLEKIYIDNLNYNSREKMLEASAMAGIAFTNAGLGINHSIAHVIGGRYHVAHGRLNGIILRYLIRYYIYHEDTTRQRLDELAKELGMNNCQNVLMRIEELLSKLDFQNALCEIDRIDGNDYMASISEMAETAYNDRCTASSPGLVTHQLLRNLLSDVYKGNLDY